MSQTITLACASVVLSAASAVQGQVSDSPVGTVAAWLKDYASTPALPAGWLECNGQVVNDSNSPYNGQSLPNLTGRFLRGNTSSGTSGGSDQHNHKWLYNESGANDPGGWQNADHEEYTFNADGVGLHDINQEIDHYTDVRSSLPSYYEVVWIIKTTNSPQGGVPAVSTWGLIVFGTLVLTAGAVLVRQRTVARSCSPVA